MVFHSITNHKMGIYIEIVWTIKNTSMKKIGIIDVCCDLCAMCVMCVYMFCVTCGVLCHVCVFWMSVSKGVCI